MAYDTEGDPFTQDTVSGTVHQRTLAKTVCPQLPLLNWFKNWGCNQLVEVVRKTTFLALAKNWTLCCVVAGKNISI
jgi:hypothetical protein